MSIQVGDLSTIQDLIARAELEPTLVDIYVEGRRDAELVRLVLAEADIDATVFPISDRLDIRSEEIGPYSEDYGNRSKLITAATQIDAALGASGHMYTFVADADWTSVIGPQTVGDTSLLLTDGPSVEHYFLESPSFQQVLSVGLERSECSASDVRKRLLGAMRDVASARLVLNQLNVSCTAKFTALCVFDSDRSSANAVEIVRRSLAAASRSSEFSSRKIVDQIAVYRGWIEDASHAGRGHDIAPILIKLLSLAGDFAKVPVVEAIMRSSVGVAELLEKQLFQKLVSRIRRNAVIFNS